MTTLHAKTEQLYKALCEHMDAHDDKPNKPLFHYTNFIGLTGILQSRHLWLTNHKFLNDPSEIEHGKKLIFKTIEQHIPNNAELSNFIKTIITAIIEEGYNLYLISFCEQGDYLPAWRYYGDNGAGFSIGFNEKYFFRCKPHEIINQSDATLFFKVQYEDNSSEKINKIFKIAKEISPDWSRKHPEEIRPYLVQLATCLLTILPCIKNKDYKDEYEWRLCITRLYKEKKWYPYNFPIENLIFSKIDTTEYTPFLKNIKTTIPRLQLLKFDYSDINTIYVGPRLDFLTAKLAIEKILLDASIEKSKLQNISIKQSERPYQ